MKQITSASDLAINGAKAAFDMPLHVGRPNIGSRERFAALLDGVFDRAWLSNNGPLVQEFEQRVANYAGVKHCIAMCNGTIALEIAIRALRMKGEVIVPSWTFIATPHALHWQGLTPVFADIDPATQNLDPDSVRRLITPRTSGIIGVHLWGRPAPVAELQEIADEHGLSLLFDAAHAFGCSAGGRMIGGFGDAEVFSFHATKFFNTFEGGAVVTDNDELAREMSLMRNFGFSGYDNVIHPGTNGKMVEVCAAMGLVNLDHIDLVVDANKRNLAAYTHAFAGMEEVSLVEYDEGERNNYQYVVIEVNPRVRDAIVDALNAENILARKYFWPGCHMMLPYRELFPNASSSLPETSRIADRVVVLPTGVGLPLEAVDVIASVTRIISRAL